jgi:hypothetical protein
MRSIIIKFINTEGIFSFSLNLKSPLPDDLHYRSKIEDRINMNNDLRNFYTDFEKATKAAKVKSTI